MFFFKWILRRDFDWYSLWWGWIIYSSNVEGLVGSRKNSKVLWFYRSLIVCVLLRFNG